MMRAAILIVCEDAGGARAIAPVANHLASLGVTIRVQAAPIAATVFEESGVAVQSNDGVAGIPDFKRALGEIGLLLTGSTAWGLRTEAVAIQAARRCGVPSLAVVDFWSNYVARFSYPGTEDRAAVPDQIAVIDTTMRSDLVALGFAPDRLALTGSPALDAVFEERTLLADSTCRTVLFLSQPIAALYGPDLLALGHPGYTERTTLIHLAAATGVLGVSLKVRPHPREDPADLGRYLHSLPYDVELAREGSLRQAVANANVVTGMTTMGLVDAALMGRPVLSLQPNRRGDDPLPTSRVGLTRTLTDPLEFRLELGMALAASAHPSALRERVEALGWRPGATQRVGELIERMMR